MVGTVILSLSRMQICLSCLSSWWRGLGEVRLMEMEIESHMSDPIDGCGLRGKAVAMSIGARSEVMIDRVVGARWKISM